MPSSRLRLLSLEDRTVPAATTKPIVEGVIWEDRNANGLREATEPPMSRVDMELYSSRTSARIATARSDSNGRYRIELPADGQYRLRFLLPTGMQFTRPGVMGVGINSEVTDTDRGEVSIEAVTGRVLPDPTFNVGLTRNAVPQAGADFTFGYGVSIRQNEGQQAGISSIDRQGNSIVAGFTSSVVPSGDPSYTNAYLAKYTPGGQLVWRTQVAARSSYIVNTTTDADNNIYVVGDTVTSVVKQNGQMFGTVYTDAFIAKYSPAGKRLWWTPYNAIGIDQLYTVSVDRLGNVFAGGSGTQGNRQAADLGKPLLLKLAANDGRIVSRTFVSADPGNVTAVIPDGSGGVRYTANIYKPSNGETSILMGQWNNAGRISSLGTIAKNASRSGNAVSVTTYGDSAGNMLLAGNFTGTVDFDLTSARLERTVNSSDTRNPYGSDIFIAQYDRLGKPLWVRTLGGEFFDSLQSIQQGSDGRIYVLGTFSGTIDFDPGPGTILRSGFYQPFLLVLDATGNFLRVRTFDPIVADGNLLPQKLLVDATGLRISGTYIGTPDIDPTPGRRLLPRVSGAVGLNLGLFMAQWNFPTPPAAKSNLKPAR